MQPTAADLAAIERLVAGLPDGKRAELARIPEVAAELAKPWRPLPGPQTAAYLSDADQLLYGGQAGGGKSHLLLGVAANDHRRSLILRRESVELDGLIDDSRQFLSEVGTFNGQSAEWTLPGGRSIRFGGMKEPQDWRKYAGRARDLIALDEAGEFLEDQVAPLLAWLRSPEGRRCRLILASNPPRTADGAWLVRWFAPWLDDMFPDPAEPGELRWCIHVGEATEWVDGPDPVTRDRETYTPVSRTFVPASVDDNPYLAETDYKRRLENLPGVLREQLLKGNFLAGREDHAWQVVPTAWVTAAQDRWQTDGAKGLRMTALGVDVAQGGGDRTVLAPRYGAWFAEPVERAGTDTPDAPSVAGLIATYRRDGAAVVVDVGGGYGGGVVAYLKDNETAAAGFNGAAASNRRTADGELAFVNRRAEAWWRLREALDPGQEGSSPVALPPDRGLRADLTAPRWKLTPRGIQIEAKDEIVKRLGRSPDKGDAVVMAWSEGQALAEKKARGARARPRVVVGYRSAKRR